VPSKKKNEKKKKKKKKNFLYHAMPSFSVSAMQATMLNHKMVTQIIQIVSDIEDKKAYVHILLLLPYLSITYFNILKCYGMRDG